MSAQNNFPPNEACPLCDKPAFVQSSQKDIDVDNVVCERCGYYRIENNALKGFEQQRHLIAGLTRHSSTPMQTKSPRLTITRDSISELLTSSGLPRDLLDQLDITLEYCKGHKQRGDQFFEYRELAEIDYPLAFASGQDEFLHFFQTLSEQQLLDEPPGRDLARRTAFRITPEGWERLRDLAKTRQDSNRAFVAMSFAPELVPVWVDGIKRALEALDYIPVRIDQTHAGDKIDNRIIAEIRRSGLLVADFTGHRSGVYFEAGFAMGLGIPVVWTCKKADYKATHFDTRQYQHLLWETPTDLREQLVNHIAARIPGHSLP